MRDHLDRSAHRVAGLDGAVHFLLHPRFNGGVNAVQDDFLPVAQSQDTLEGHRVTVECHAPQGDDVARDFDAKFSEEQFRQCTRSHAGGSLARASPLEHVTRVAEVVLETTRKVSVSGPRGRERPMLSPCFRPVLHGHCLFPIGPVTVLDEDCDRRSDRLPVPHAGQELRRVRLELHSSAASVPSLAALHFPVDEVKVDP